MRSRSGGSAYPSIRDRNGNANLPKDRLIVTYCGGGTSGVAAANILADNGFNARVMEGFRAWQAADCRSKRARTSPGLRFMGSRSLAVLFHGP